MWSHYQRTIEGIEMNKIKKALEKCRTYVAVQKFGCGHTGIGHGVEDNLLQLLNEAFEELAWLEKREPTLMSDCISAGLPLDVALKYDVQLCRLTNYVRDKTLADCVKQEPIDESWCIEPKPVNGLLVSEHMEQEPVAHYKDAPHTIYLQTGCDDPEDCECSFNEWGDTTWCADQIHDTDIPYIRADYAAPVSARREWVDLTPIELAEAFSDKGSADAGIRAVIAAFKEKNK